jgi:hypothetical protein
MLYGTAVLSWHPWYVVFEHPAATLLTVYSPTFILIAIPRHSTKRLVPVSAGDMQSSGRPQISVLERGEYRARAIQGIGDVKLRIL